jgi:hypothetical protein
MNSAKKSWHQELALATKLKPNRIPQDIFFQFTRRQPYDISKNSYKRTFSTMCPDPLEPSNKENQRLKNKKNSRPASRNNQFETFDNCFFYNKDASDLESKILKKKKTIVNELQVMFEKNKSDKKKYFGLDNPDEEFKSYRSVSDRIVILTKRKKYSIMNKKYW